MKTYEANEELIEILKKNNFIEISSGENKGKKSFKLTERDKKVICFDYINIRIFYQSAGQEHRMSMNESELKMLLLYFKLSAPDWKELNGDLTFNFNSSTRRFKNLKEELEDLKEDLKSSKVLNRRIAKLERILEVHNQLSLNN